MITWGGNNHVQMSVLRCALPQSTWGLSLGSQAMLTQIWQPPKRSTVQRHLTKPTIFWEGDGIQVILYEMSQ